MADAGGIRAGRAFVEIGGNNSKLVSVLNQTSRKMQSWGSSITSMGSKIFAGGMVAKGALAALTTIFEEAGTAIANMASRTGIAAEQISQLKYAAQQSGIGLEDLETGFRKMQKALGEASIGSSEAAQKFEAIGLHVQDLINLSPEQQFEAIANAISQIQNPAQRAAAVMGIFGKSGTALLPMLEQGASGIRNMMEEADKLGLTMSSADAQGAKRLHQSMTKVWATLQGAAIAVGSALAPALTDLADRAASVVGVVVNWIKDNRGLIVTISTIVTGVVAAGAAIMLIGGIISGVGVVLGVLASAVAAIGTVISAVFGAAVAVIGFLISPIGIVSALVVGLAGYFLYTSGVIDQVVTFLSDAFGGLAEDCKVAFDAIKAALGAGDFGAAAKVLWAFLKLEWVKGLNFINGIWLSAKTFFLETWTAAGFKLNDIFNTACDGVYDIFDAMMTTLRVAWWDLMGFYADTFKGMIDGLEPVLKVLGVDTDTLKMAMGVMKMGADAAADAEQATSNDDSDDRNEDRAARQAVSDQALREAMAAYEKAKEDASNKGTKEAEQNLADAKAGLAEAAAAAKEAGNKPAKGMAAAASSADALDDINVQGKSSVTGTFNAFALSGLGGGVQGPMDEVRKNTADTKSLTRDGNKILEDIRDNTSKPGVVFT